jgi:phospholipid-translocating ATPase
MNGIAIFCSVGGWFLWNLILTFTYNPSTKVYYVRDTFISSFGKSGTWWLSLILILTSVLVFEFAVASLRSAFFTTDEDVFQALEQDGSVKRRFEEAASAELQQGWDRKTNRERDQAERVRSVVELLERKEEERREGEVKELLRGRVEREEVDGSPERAGDGHGDGAREGERDPSRLLERGFGRVREDELGR